MRYIKEPAAPGCRAYAVELADGTFIGTVHNRPGGWWRAWTPDGAWASSSFCRTRREAATGLLRAALGAGVSA